MNRPCSPAQLGSASSTNSSHVLRRGIRLSIRSAISVLSRGIRAVTAPNSISGIRRGSPPAPADTRRSACRNFNLVQERACGPADISHVPRFPGLRSFPLSRRSTPRLTYACSGDVLLGFSLEIPPFDLDRSSPMLRSAAYGTLLSCSSTFRFCASSLTSRRSWRPTTHRKIVLAWLDRRCRDWRHSRPPAICGAIGGSNRPTTPCHASASFLSVARRRQSFPLHSQDRL